MNPLVGFFLLLGLMSWGHDSIAAVESVSPVSGGYTWQGRNSYVSITGTTPQEACQNQFNYWTGAGGVTGYTLAGVNKLNDWTYECWVIRTSDSAYLMLSYEDRVGTAPVCPSDPDGLGAYVYNNVTAMCERTVPDAPADPCSGVTVTETFSITDACLSYDAGSPTCAPQTIQHACGTLYKKTPYDCTANAARTLCSSTYGAQDAPESPMPAALASDCLAGQALVTSSSGKKRCYNDNTGGIASAVAASQTLADAANTQKINDAMAAASAVGGTAAGEVGAGVAAALNGSGSGSGTASNPFPVDPTKNEDLANLCADDPLNPICGKGSGDVGAASLQGSDLYTKKDKTINSVLGKFSNDLQSAPVFTAATGFFTVGAMSASCPIWTIDIPLMGSRTVDAFCSPAFTDLLPWIKAVFLIVFSYAAFRIAIL